MNDNLKSEEITFLDSNIKNKRYSIRIGERIYKRISKHIDLLKRLKHIHTQQDWILEAIKEKLEREDKLDLSENLHKDKYLGFQISPQIESRISQQVDIIKQSRSSYSKKQWILEAIYDSLDIEEKETEKKAKELFKVMISSSNHSKPKSSPIS